jgi:hypothetical protein
MTIDATERLRRSIGAGIPTTPARALARGLFGKTATCIYGCSIIVLTANGNGTASA